MKIVQAKWLSLGVCVSGLSSTSVLADVSARIINGKEATQEIGRLPAALVSRNAWMPMTVRSFCGASFIGERYAGNCRSLCGR